VQTQEKFEFRKSLFWEAKTEEMSMSKNAPFIIERVLERGTTEEWQKIKTIYGLEKIKQEALQAKYLTKQTLYFCSVYFSEPIENFRSWQNQMLLPENMRWIY
jgi:hypothetical protein